MVKAMLTFEDNNEEVIIGIENVLSDNPTPAQNAALQLFLKIKQMINGILGSKVGYKFVNKI